VNFFLLQVNELVPDVLSNRRV